jgi:glutamate racemase
VIAFFDSGLGGLSVLAAARVPLPAHDVMYVADSAFCPYGPRPVAQIVERSLVIGREVQQRGARLLVVACNAASAGALEELRAALEIPVIGMEPGVKPAIEQTRSGVVGVLATATTTASPRLASLVERFADGVTVLTQACPGLVEWVERGELDAPGIRELVTRYVEPLSERGADVLVLGCTHYPYLRPLIEDAAGDGVTIIDTGPAVARQVVRVAEAVGIAAGAGKTSYFTTGDPANVDPVLRQLTGDTNARAVQIYGGA